MTISIQTSEVNTEKILTEPNTIHMSETERKITENITVS